MRLYLSKKMGPFRLGGSFKLTWWNAIFVAMAAMCYYMVLLSVYLIELIVMVYYYLFKWTINGVRWCWRKIRSGKNDENSQIESKTAGQ